MKLLFVLVAGLFSYIVYGFYIAQVDLTSTQNQIELKTLTTFYDYHGAMNVHSARSNGSGTPEEIIQEAQAAGLDFIVLTDVNDFPLPTHLEGYHGKLLVFVGGEYSFLDSRILYLSLNKDQFFQSLGSMQLHLTDLLSRTKPELKDELLVLARPFQRGRYTWSGSYPEGLDGIEIINLKEMAENLWRESPVRFLWSFFVLPFNLQYAYLRLYSSMDKETELWDRLNQDENKLYGYLGNNSTAKAFAFKDFHIQFPSHFRSFSTASNHVLLQSELTGNTQKDSEKIFRALKQGQFYQSIDLLADPTGFTAYMNQGNKIYPLGARVPLEKGLKLQVNLPAEPKYFYEVVALLNGERVMTTNTTELVLPIESPGTYRVIVRVIPNFPLPDGKKWITWIHTNPFFVE